MGSKSKTITYGIAYHSPLDIISLLPHDLKVTTNTDAKADVCFTKEFHFKVAAENQLVFSSQRGLLKKSIPILDQGERGQILNLKSIEWTNFLKGSGNG